MLGIQELISLLREEDVVALATLIDVSGGSSKRLGARAVYLHFGGKEIHDDVQNVGQRRGQQVVWNDDRNDGQEGGRFVGSLTAGGCVDAEAAIIAARVAECGIPEIAVIDLGDEGLDFGMSCAGSVTVFVEPIEPIRTSLLDVLGKVLEENAAGRTGTIALRLNERSDRYVFIGGDTNGTELPESVSDVPPGKPQFIRSAESAIFVESFARRPRLIVVGASPIADPLVRLGKMIGFEVVVVASRTVGEERFGSADAVHCGMPSEICTELSLDSNCFVVITAHDYKFEVPVLLELVSRDLAYLGFVASRRRGAAVLEFLRTTGVETRDIENICVPVGLDIGAVTPEEIAVSITAELLATQNERSGGSMQLSINSEQLSIN